MNEEAFYLAALEKMPRQEAEAIAADLAEILSKIPQDGLPGVHRIYRNGYLRRRLQYCSKSETGAAPLAQLLADLQADCKCTSSAPLPSPSQPAVPSPRPAKKKVRRSFKKSAAHHAKLNPQLAEAGK